MVVDSGVQCYTEGTYGIRLEQQIIPDKEKVEMMKENKQEKPEDGREEKRTYSFVQEQIKDRPVNKRKLFRRTLTTVILAIVFGLVACLTFLLIEPVINKMLNPEQISKVEFPEEEQEISPEQLLTENAVALKEEAQEEAVREEAVKEAMQEAQKNMTASAFTTKDYAKLYNDFYSIARQCNSFMVMVTGISEREDWITGTTENEKATSGLIVADNGAELLILADGMSISGAQEYYVRFCDKQLVKANMKKMDKQTGLAIFAVNLSDMKTATKNTIMYASLGVTAAGSLIGEPVIAIGAPLGTSDSISYGMITANGNRLNVTDAAYNVILTDMNMGQNASGVIISLEKEVLGVICSSVKNIGGTNTISTIGISDIKTLIAKLSNGEGMAYIGIKGMDVTQEAHTEIGVPYGAYVTEVAMQSPAMKAGILNGDVIVSIGGQQISSFREYRSALLSLTPQSNVEIKLMRYDGNDFNEVAIEVVLAEA